MPSPTPAALLPGRVGDPARGASQPKGEEQKDMQGTYREKGATKTLKISVEVRSGAVRFRVSVRAESIERAL